MNKIFKVKRNSRGQSVVCSEIAKSKTKGRVIASALAVAVAGLMSTVTAQAAATVGDSGTYSAVLLDVVAQGGAYSDSTIGAVAIGSNLKYTDAYGRQASTEATAPLSIAIGVGATARAVDGVPADSTNPDDPNFAQPLAAIAVGTSATANGYTSTAIGYRSSAIDRSSSAFGVQANAENFMATAIGAGSTASGFTTTAVGSNTEAVGRNSVAVGVARHSNGAVASGEQGILLGSADIEGLTAEQLQGVQYAGGANPWSSFQGVDLSNPAQTTGESRASIVSGKNALGVGVAVKATGERSIAEGYYANAASLDAIAIGSQTQATANKTIAIGKSTEATKINDTAIGHNAIANGGKSIAIGSSNDNDRGSTLANGTYSVAIGPSAQATGRGGIVIGENASANGIYRNLDTKEVFTGGSLGHNTVVIGREAQTFYDHDTVVGALAAVKKSPHAAAGRTEALWDKQPATIMGFKATSSGEGGDTLIGAHASNDHRQTFPIGQSTALGSRAFVYGDQGTALGADTSAVGNSSIAIGNDDFVVAKAKLTQSIPEIAELGIDLKAVENLSDVAFANGVPDSMMKAAGEPTALGTSGLNWNVRTASLGDASMAMGSSTQAGGDASIAMGFNALTRGSSSIAMGSLARSNGTNAIAQGTATSAHAFDSIAIGRYATAGAAGDELATANATAIGSKSKAVAIDSIAVGAEASVSGEQSIAIGKASNVSGSQSIAVGVGHIVEANSAGAFGDPSYLTAGADGSYAIGNNNTVTTANTFVLGNGINRGSDFATNGAGTVENSVYLGNESEVTAGAGVGTKALGVDQVVGTTTTAGDTGVVTEAKVGTTTYSGFAGATANGAVSVGASGAERRIQNVAAGEISATSTDAINGSQLYAMAEVIEEIKTTPDVDTDKSVRLTSSSPLLTVSNAAGAKDGITDMTDYTISLNTDLLPKTVVAKGTGTTVTSSKDGDTTTYTVSVDDTIADKQFVADEIAKIPVVTDTNTDKSVRVASSSELLTVSNTAGTADGITNMTDYTIALSDKVATKDFVTEEIAKIQLPVDTDTNSISKVEQGNGVTVTSIVNGDTTTFTVAVDDTIANKQFVTEEIAKIKMPEFTDTNTVSEVAAGEGILVDAVTEGDKTTYTVSLDKTKLPSILDTNTDKSVRVSSDSDLITVTSAEGTADGITTMTDYTISVSDKVATKDYVDSKLPVVEAGDNVVVKTNTVDGKSIYTVSANSSSVTKGDGIAVEMTETTATNGAVNRDYKVSLDNATKAQLAKEESVVAKAGQTNIKVTQPRTNGTGGNEFEVDLASDLTNINSIANGDTKLSLGDAQVSVNGATITNVASPVNATDAVNKQYVDDSKPTVSEGYGITVTETPTTKGAATSIDYNVALNEKTKQTLDQVAVNTGNINKGINTRTEDDQVVNHKLGDTISVVGDNKNITTATTEDGAISVKMSDDIKVNSVSINNTAITMGGNGIHAGDMKVTGVAPGVISPSSTDAVNGSQLFATNVAIADNRRMINELGDQVNNRMDNMQDEYRAGIADAAAIAGLPEIHLTGKSMIAVAGSTFKGESALAVGFSSLSDNSRIKFKATGSVNTQGDFLGTVGAGWAF